MSTLATAPERAGQASPAASSDPAGSRWPLLDAVLAVGIAALVVAVAFLTSASSDPAVPVTGSYTWTEVVLTLLGAAAVGMAVLMGGRGPVWGAGTIGWFAAFTAFAALSIVWSVQPDWSWYGANQLVCYLAVLAGAAALARGFPDRWRAVVGGVALATVSLSGYALLAKVFPATLASGNQYGRLQAPFGYWNAVGAAGGIGLPVCLWLGARRAGGLTARSVAAARSVLAVRSLAAPGLTVLISAIVLSYSRSAILMGVVGLAVWLAFVPLRLRSALVLAVGAAGAVPVVVWALSHQGVSGDGVAAGVQDAAGHTFGIVLVGVLALAWLAGLAAAWAMDRVAVTARVRRRIGTALLGGLALVPVLAVVALAASHRGFTGEISHAWTSLTGSKGVSETSARLTQLGSSRPGYWREGLHVGGDALLKGAGELGYGIARLRFTNINDASHHAHSYLVQTFADLGLIGLALTVGLVVAWAIAALRACGGRMSWDALQPHSAAERAGLVAMAATVIGFGVQSALDWTWYFAGVAVPVLLCAGWLAGRGPLLAPAGGGATARVSLRQRPGAGATLTVLAVVAVVAAWLMWQPLRAADAIAAAQDAGATPAGLADARGAVHDDPLSVQALLTEAVIYQAMKNDPAARATLVKATRLAPDDPDPWTVLGGVDLHTGHPRTAIADMNRVLALDHTGDSGQAGDPDAAAARITISQADADLGIRSSG